MPMSTMLQPGTPCNNHEHHAMTKNIVLQSRDKTPRNDCKHDATARDIMQ